jgi:hypothetical protein
MSDPPPEHQMGAQQALQAYRQAQIVIHKAQQALQSYRQAQTVFHQALQAYRPALQSFLRQALPTFEQAQQVYEEHLDSQERLALLAELEKQQSPVELLLEVHAQATRQRLQTHQQA